jgi:hypothetical protein
MFSQPRFAQHQATDVDRRTRISDESGRRRRLFKKWPTASEGSFADALPSLLILGKADRDMITAFWTFRPRPEAAVLVCLD